MSKVKKVITGIHFFFLSQYQISLHIQWIRLNFALPVPFLVIHAASILVFHIFCCGSSGQIWLLLCTTFIFLKHCALFDYIIFLLRHLSSISYQLIELVNFVFYSWASEIWLHISFSTLFSANKKQKGSMPEILVYKWNHPSVFLMQTLTSCFFKLLRSAPHLLCTCSSTSPGPLVQLSSFLSFLPGRPLLFSFSYLFYGNFQVQPFSFLSLT